MALNPIAHAAAVTLAIFLFLAVLGIFLLDSAGLWIALALIPLVFFIILKRLSRIRI